MPEDYWLAELRYWLGLWLDWYPISLALVALLGLRPPRQGRRLLRWLNLTTAAAGLLWLLAIGYEAGRAWYSQVEFEQYAFVNRVAGPYWWAYWGLLLPHVGSQGFWWRRGRQSWRWSVGYALVGMLLPVLERWVVILTSRHRDYLPSSWAMFTPDALWRWPLYLVALALLLGLRPWRKG